MANVKINGITYSGIDSIKIPNASGSGQTTFSIPPTTQTKIVTPSTTQQTVTPDDGKLLSAVVVAAMPEGSVNAPSASKGSVNNHSITVTPNVSYTTGYITSGSKSGASTTISASELVSGSRSITSNGNNIDVTNYKYVNVNVSEGGGGITPTGTINITSAGDTDVTTYATAHVDGGSVSSPTASKGSVSNHSITVTPSVSYSEGYIEDGSKTGTGVSVSASELVSGTMAIEDNGTGIDVTNYKYVNVNVSSGGGSGGTGTSLGIATKTITANSSIIVFDNLLGNPSNKNWILQATKSFDDATKNGTTVSVNRSNPNNSSSVNIYGYISNISHIGESTYSTITKGISEITLEYVGTLSAPVKGTPRISVSTLIQTDAVTSTNYSSNSFTINLNATYQFCGESSGGNTYSLLYEY